MISPLGKFFCEYGYGQRANGGYWEVKNLKIEKNEKIEKIEKKVLTNRSLCDIIYE